MIGYYNSAIKILIAKLNHTVFHHASMHRWHHKLNPIHWCICTNIIKINAVRVRIRVRVQVLGFSSTPNSTHIQICISFIVPRAGRAAVQIRKKLGPDDVGSAGSKDNCVVCYMCVEVFTFVAYARRKSAVWCTIQICFGANKIYCVAQASIIFN